MGFQDPQYNKVKPSTPKNVRAGNRLKDLFFRAKMLCDSEFDVFQFIDKPMDQDGNTPRKLALQSDDGLACAIRYMDKHLVNS